MSLFFNTTLIEGSIKISNTILKPGQQARIKDEKISINKSADIEQVMAWKNGYFQFNDASTEEIMRQVQRWYDVSIEYEGNVKAETFSGYVPRSVNASELIKALEMTKTVKFIIGDKKIIVKPYQ